MGSERNFKRESITLVAGVRQQISSSPVFTSKIYVHVPSGDTGPVYLGDETVDATWIPMAKASGAGKEDGTYIFTASEDAGQSEGDYFNLSKLYLFSASADSVIVEYLVGK